MGPGQRRCRHVYAAARVMLGFQNRLPGPVDLPQFVGHLCNVGIKACSVGHTRQQQIGFLVTRGKHASKTKRQIRDHVWRGVLFGQHTATREHLHPANHVRIEREIVSSARGNRNFVEADLVVADNIGRQQRRDLKTILRLQGCNLFSTHNDRHVVIPSNSIVQNLVSPMRLRQRFCCNRKSIVSQVNSLRIELRRL